MTLLKGETMCRKHSNKLQQGELQHRLVVTYLVKKKVKKVMRKKGIERRKVWKGKEDDTRARFESW